MNTDDKLSFIFGRRSIREYQSAPVPDELVTDLLRAAMAAPSRARRIPGVSWWCETAHLEVDRRGLANGKMLAHAPVGIAVCAIWARLTPAS